MKRSSQATCEARFTSTGELERKKLVNRTSPFPEGTRRGDAAEGVVPLQKKTRYTLTLEADGSRDEADAIRKLRALLKRLGRTYGLRAVSIRPEATIPPRGQQ